MEISVKQKRIWATIIAFIAFVFCSFTLSFFAVRPVQAETESYDVFENALFDMIEYNESQNDNSEVELLSAQSEKEEKPTNRLIVTSFSKLDDCGAVASAKYEDIQIFQYEDQDSAQQAYNYFSTNEKVDSVMFDEAISAQDIEIEAEATTYKSWGASFLGYEDYITTLSASGTALHDVYVAVLDSGINTSHEQFKDRIMHQYAYNFTAETNVSGYAYEDFNGHGTHVSGIIANATPSCVKIIPLKVLDKKGDGYVSYITNAIKKVQSYVNSGLDVKLMNMSIGVKTTSVAEGQITANSDTLTYYIKSAYNSGILSIVSAGNERMDTTYCSPANVDIAVTVSALYKYTATYPSREESVLFDSSYSNYGAHVDFSAPGSSIASAGISSSTSYVLMSGTSMAAPHVTACYALVYCNSNYSSYSVSEMNNLMQQNAVDLGSSGWDSYYGYGCINVSNIGIMNSGYVEFSVQEDMHTDSFELSLSYDMSAFSSAYSCEIYYSTDEFASTIDKSQNTLFDSSPIMISQTTKVTAVAFVYSENGSLIQRSFTSTKIYYFDNIDLQSNYVFESGEYSTELVVAKYNGVLTTLNVPSIANGKFVRGVNYRAFNSSNVEILYLPYTVDTIYSSAFYNNTTIKEIHCYATSVDVGASAFRYSTIQIFNVYASNVGDYAFANCPNLEILYLPCVIQIGQHAFSASALKTVLIGQDILSIKNQTNLSIEKVYGYAGTIAESDFANAYGLQFYDLTLRFSQDLVERKIVSLGSEIVFDVGVVGVGMEWNYSFSGSKTSVSYAVQSNSDYAATIRIKLSSLAVGEYTFKVYFEDFYGNQIASQQMSVIVVSASAPKFSISYPKGDFDVYLDGELVEANAQFFKGYDYKLTVMPKDGYSLSKVYVNGVELSAENPTVLLKSVSQDQTIVVQTNQDDSFVINFETDSAHGSVYVGEWAVTSFVVERADSLKFKVEAAHGYVVEDVSVDGTSLTADSFGEYCLSNVLSDKTVIVTFVRPVYTISIIRGNGGGYSISGASGNTAAHGSTVILRLSSSDGYIIESVLLNGKEVKLDGSVLTLENITQDYEIVIQCGEHKSSFITDSAVIRYLIVLASIFVVFILASIILYFARKEKDKNTID